MSLTKRYGLFIVVTLLLAVACVNFIFFSGKAVIDNSVSIWFDQRDPELVSYERYNDNFGDAEWSTILLETENIYDPKFLQQLAHLTSELTQIDDIFRIISITNAQESISNTESELTYSYIVDQQLVKKGLSHQQAEQLKARLLLNKNLVNMLIRADDTTHTAILVKNGNYIDRQDDYRIQLEDAIIKKINQYDTVKRHYMVGTTILNSNLNRTSLRDVYIYYTGITLTLLVIGFLMFRNIKDVALMLAVVGSSLIVSMGGLALLSIPYNMVTVMLPTCIVAMSTSSIIHVIDHYKSTYDQHKDAIDTAHQTIRQLFKPTLLTTGTTILGFLSLCFSTVQPIAQLGLFVSIGLFFCWLVSVFIAPYTLAWIYPNGIHKQSRNIRFLNRLMDFLDAAPKRRWILLIFILLPLVGLLNLRTDTDYSEFFGTTHALSQSYDKFDQTGFGQNPIAFTYEFSNAEDYEYAKYAKQIQSFEEAVFSDERVLKSLSMSDVLEQAADAYLELPQGTSRVVEMDEAKIAQLILLAESSGNKDVADLYRTQSVQTIVLTPYMSSQELKKFMSNVNTVALGKLPKEVLFKMNGTTVLWANMDSAVSKTQLRSLVFMSLVILLAMLYLKVSWIEAIAATLINVIPLLTIFGVMGLLDIPINLATAIIAGISLGVMVDDTIHVISSVKHKVNVYGVTPTQAIFDTIRTTGLTLVKTTMILMGCFAVLCTSNFVPTNNFGYLIAFGLFLALIYDLFYLPVILKYLMPNVKRFSFEG